MKLFDGHHLERQPETMPAATESSANERAIDRVLADSFPASDAPPWTLGVLHGSANDPTTLNGAKSRRRSRSVNELRTCDGAHPEHLDSIEEEMMRDREIVVTEFDQSRLRKLLEGPRRWSARDRTHVDHLESELDRAEVVRPIDVPPDVVTMNSEVAVRDMDSNEEMIFAVVFPADANVNRQKISILAPIGTAVLGYRVGDTIVWNVPGRTRRLRIERVLFQPEAAWQFDL